MLGKRRWSLRRVIVGVLGAVTSVWLALVAAVVLVGAGDDRRASDAIVVLGAAQYAGRPSPVLRARLDHAITLWFEGVAPVVVLTGGRGDGDTTSEAAVGARYLRARGVPDSALVLETDGRTTSQSVRRASELLRARDRVSVVLVSDPFHALRARVLALRWGLDAVTSPTRTSPIAQYPAREWRYVLTEAIKVPVAAILPSW
jgi:uncharacterized SAM-binding protein YcdF (DUF218 family)